MFSDNVCRIFLGLARSFSSVFFLSLSTSAFCCKIILSDPHDGQAGIAVNHSVFVVSERTRSEKCVFHAVDANNQEIPLSVVYSSSPLFQGETVRQISVVRPLSLLWKKDQKYKVALRSGTHVSAFIFQTNKSDYTIEGRLDSVSDNPVRFSPWQPRTLLLSSDITDSLDVFLRLKLGSTKISENRRKELAQGLHRAFPYFSSPHARYDVKIKNMIYYAAQVNGSLSKFSALLIYPVGAQVHYNQTKIVLFDIRSHADYKPSRADNYISWLGSVVASMGYVFVAPDAVDHPRSVPTDAVPFYQAKKNIDLLEATREYFLKTYFSSLPNQPIFAGSFNGGRDVLTTLLLSSFLSYPLPSAVFSNGARYDFKKTFSDAISCSASQVPSPDNLSAFRGVVQSFATYWQGYYFLNNAWTETGVSFDTDDVGRCLQFQQDLLLSSLVSQRWSLRAPNTAIYLYQYFPDRTLPSDNVSALSSAILSQSNLRFVTHRSCETEESNALMKAGFLGARSVCGFFMFDDLLRTLSANHFAEELPSSSMERSGTMDGNLLLKEDFVKELASKEPVERLF